MSEAPSAACRLETKRWDWRRLVSSGGMPSSHTALIMGVTTATAITDGVSSSVFAICAVMTLIVGYDAASVRRAAGKHAAILNQLMAELPAHRLEEGPMRGEQQLDARLGHTPVQVLSGAALGFAVGIILQAAR